MAAEITAGVRLLAEAATGDQTILVNEFHTSLVSSSTASSRARMDVPGSMQAQRLMPTPMVGRSVINLVNRAIQANGFVVVQARNDAAGTLDSVGAATPTDVQLGIIVNDLTKPNGAGNKYQVGRLSVGGATPVAPYQRDTTRVPDDPVGSTSKFVDFMAWKCPTGQAWLVHGESRVFFEST